MERGMCLAALLVALFVKLFTVDDPGTKALAEGETAKAKSTKTLFMLQHTALLKAIWFAIRHRDVNIHTI
jgi:hypothetical protein